MGRRVIQVYVAVVCFAAMLFALYDAPRFFRARLNSETREFEAGGAMRRAEETRLEMEKAEHAAGHVLLDGAAEQNWSYASGKMLEALELESKANDAFKIQQEYALFVGVILGGHLLLLFVSESVYLLARRRSARVPSP
jgi:hypothetical protein